MSSHLKKYSKRIKKEIEELMAVIKKILNGYCNIGGNRKLWNDVEVTAVELIPEIAQQKQIGCNT